MPATIVLVATAVCFVHNGNVDSTDSIEIDWWSAVDHMDQDSCTKLCLVDGEVVVWYFNEVAMFLFRLVRI